MEIILRFFDKKTWSYFATINVLIPVILLIIIQKRLGIQEMIFVSLMGMMDGNIYSKVIFTGFLNLLVFKPDIYWVIRSIIYIISIALMNTVEKNNTIQRVIMNYTTLQYIMNLIITIWVCYIMYNILLKLYKYGRKITKNRS